MSCPCGAGPDYDACCGPYIEGTALPPTAEALMRSRYTAYVRGAIDHVVATHEPKTRGDIDRQAATRWSESAEWLGLEIVATEAGGPEDRTGVVEFVARYNAEGAEQRHHERASFTRDGDRWFYADGDMVKAQPVVREAPKVGRNEPCPCGSGKKFKKCCG